MITRSRQQYLRDILLVLLMFLLELAVKVSGNPVLQRRVNKYLSAIPGQVIHFEHKINPSLYCYRFVQFGEKNLKEKHIDPFPLYLRVDRYNNYTLANTSHGARDRVTYEGRVEDGFIDIVLHNTKLTDSKTYRLYTMVQENSRWYTVIVDYYLVCHKVDNSTDGNSTDGNSTDNNSMDGNSTDGNSTDGNSTEKPTHTSKDTPDNGNQQEEYGPKNINLGYIVLFVIVSIIVPFILINCCNMLKTNKQKKKKKKNADLEEGAKANSSRSANATYETIDENEMEVLYEGHVTPEEV